MMYYTYFLLSTIFLFFFHKQHNIISKIKQNKTADTYSTSQGSIKREGEREGQQEHKSHSSKQSRIFSKKHCQASMVEGLAPPTRAVVHSHVDNLQEATDPICLSTHVWCKPVLNYCLLHSCKTSKQHSLLQRPESSLRRHKLGLTDQSILSNDDKTRFTCVHRLMTTGHSQNICRKVPDDVVLHIWQFKFDCSFILNLL